MLFNLLESDLSEAQHLVKKVEGKDDAEEDEESGEEKEEKAEKKDDAEEGEDEDSGKA
jgi:hypothetical protein